MLARRNGDYIRFLSQFIYDAFPLLNKRMANIRENKNEAAYALGFRLAGVPSHKEKSGI